MEIIFKWMKNKQIEANRHVLYCDMLDVDLHGFGDASRVVYGAVVYVKNLFVNTVLRLVCGLGNAVSRL